MKILVIGSGGREHALVWKLAQSHRVKKIFCAPGNAGISLFAECVPYRVDDIDGFLDFVKTEAIDFTVVGPEIPLVAGIVDVFQKEGLLIFGPSQKAAQLEASKSFAKAVMKKCAVPTADSSICHTVDEVLAAVGRFGVPVVLKADGLAAGKGVVICATADDARRAAKEMLVDKIFGEAGNRVLVEECLAGEETSILFLTNGIDVVPLASSQDHKRIFDKDIGPNTGGMGAYSPAPVATQAILDEVINRVARPVIAEMSQEGMRYRGILYVGIMVTDKGPKVLEFNVRLGDPETQAVLMRLDSDLVEAMLWTLTDEKAPQLAWNPKASVCVVLASGGYPGNYEKNKVITGLDQAAMLPDVVVFHAGTKHVSAKSQELRAEIVTNGGRVLGVTGLGATIKEAITTAYRAVGLIHFDGMHYRRDIGWRAQEKG